MKHAAVLLLALSGAALSTVDTSSATTDRSLTIVEPLAEAVVSGRITIEARVDSDIPDVESVRFFADGKLICEVSSKPYACPWDAGPERVSHQIRVVARRPEGENLVTSLITAEHVFSDFAFASSVRLVRVPTVVTHKGRFVTDLKREDFRLYEEGEPRDIVNFVSREAPVELVVAVDASASMVEGMPSVKQAVKSFLSLLAPVDKVTVLAFNDQIYTLARRDIDREAAFAAVDKLEPWGKTSLYDAAIRAFDTLDRAHGKRALVIFTDGEDVASQSTLDEVVTRARSSDATLYIVGDKSAIKDKKVKKIVERLATGSAGRAFFDRELDKLEQIFREIHEEISSQYLLGFTPPDVPDQKSWRGLKVEVDRQRHRVRARKGYLPHR